MENPITVDRNEIFRGNRILNYTTEGIVKLSAVPGIDIKHYGKNSLVIIRGDLKKCNCVNVRAFMGEGSILDIGENFRVRFNSTIDARADNVSVRIGKNANVGELIISAGDEPRLSLDIGDNFLASIGCYIRLADGHTIFDLESGEILNHPTAGIKIGNHVWCGYNTTILKNTEIPSDCIIGAGSIVSGFKFQNNSIIAGVPAKVIRTGVGWDSRTINKYLNLVEYRVGSDRR